MTDEQYRVLSGYFRALNTGIYAILGVLVILAWAYLL